MKQGRARTKRQIKRNPLYTDGASTINDDDEHDNTRTKRGKYGRMGSIRYSCGGSFHIFLVDVLL